MEKLLLRIFYITARLLLVSDIHLFLVPECNWCVKLVMQISPETLEAWRVQNKKNY